MLAKELFSICTLYGISPIHAGSGAATSAVDLPIQRERHTNWPHIQASGVKGAMRDHYRRFAEGDKGKAINFIFGSDKDNDGKEAGFDLDLPGAISISDAKLLAFPMRSNVAPFVWVTCPAVLKRLENDLVFTGIGKIQNTPSLKGEEAIGLRGNFKESVILEDAVVTAKDTDQTFRFPEGFPEMERLLLVSDEMFDYCVSSCTEVQTQIKIESSSGTAKDGALRYQELLPADSVLYAIVYYSNSSGLNELHELQAEMVQAHIEDVIKDFIQIGGDETLGRGICRISWLKSNNGKGGQE